MNIRIERLKNDKYIFTDNRGERYGYDTLNEALREAREEFRHSGIGVRLRTRPEFLVPPPAPRMSLDSGRFIGEKLGYNNHRMVLVRVLEVNPNDKYPHATIGDVIATEHCFKGSDLFTYESIAGWYGHLEPGEETEILGFRPMEPEQKTES